LPLFFARIFGIAGLGLKQFPEAAKLFDHGQL
jgi:hypothetical protein